MRLTHYSDYALRSLIYLATKPNPESLANISDIADSYNISKSHLTKIVHHLGKLGYIESVRGKNGGIRLGMSANDINIGALVRQTECDFKIVECFSETPLLTASATPSNKKGEFIAMVNSDTATQQCAIAPNCQLKWILAKATQAFIAVLDEYTLADIISNKNTLAQLLHES